MATLKELENIFDKNFTIPELLKTEKTSEKLENDEWIWVEGYKGTDSKMCCRDYQFELGKQFDIPEGESIQTCKTGFHFCRRLRDVYRFYNVGHGNRFFKVRALVRECDWKVGNSSGYVFLSPDKYAARSIEFIRELTPDEILSEMFDIDIQEWSESDKLAALSTDPKIVRDASRFVKLTSLGYSDVFARYLSKDTDLYNRAVAIASQEGVSMDMKVFFITYNNK